VTTRRIVTALAAELNAELDVSRYGFSSQGFRVGAYSPSGYVWVANLAHVLISDNNGHGAAWLEWRDTYDRMSMGIERCVIDDCDYCQEAATPTTPREARP